MNLKLTRQEIQSLLMSMQPVYLVSVTFNTTLEKKLSVIIMSEFFKKQFLKVSMNYNQEKFNLKIDEKTLLVLNHVLPQIYPTNDYDLSVMTRIIQEINQACLSI